MEGKELQPIISSAWRLSPSIGSSLKVLMISSEHQFFHLIKYYIILYYYDFILEN